MASKAKKPVHPMPTLGVADQILYLGIMILTGGFAGFGLFLTAIVQERIAFSDPAVIAYTVGPGAINHLFLVMWCLLACLLTAGLPYYYRYPIFGRRDIRYGPPAWPRVYPLLMKNKPTHWVSPAEDARKKKWTIIIAAIILITFLFSLAMFPLSLFGRTVMHDDGSVLIYDPFNRVQDEYTLLEITGVRLDTYRSSGKSARYWHAEVVVETEGGDFSFALHCFSDDTARALGTMLTMKALYGDLVTIEGTDNLPDVVRDQHLTEEEASLLYTLFS